MRQHTMIEAAMARAGLDTSGARLYVEATGALRAAGGDTLKAWRPFMKAVMRDEDLVRALAMRYLSDVDADMDGLPGKDPTGGDREVHINAVHPRQADRDEAGQVSHAQARQPTVARPAREPTQAQKAADSAVMQALSKTVLDTFKVDGKPVGDLTIGEVRKIGRQKGMEHYVLAAISSHYANAPSNALVRELIKPPDLSRMIKDAKEASDVF